MIWLLVLGITLGWLLLGLIFGAIDGKYKSTYNHNDPNDIYFNPTLNELRKKNEHDQRNW